MLIKDGVLHIWDCQHHLLARVQRSKNKLFLL
jgi:hypothetical protein